MEGHIGIVKRPSAGAVLNRWNSQYPPHRRDAGKQKISEALAALPENACRNSIDEAIGNKSWTTLECDMCGADCEKLIQFETYERHISVCVDCTTAALNNAEAQ